QEVTLLSHLRSPLLILFLSSFMITFMIGGIDAVLALFTSERLGFSSAEVGLVFTYIGVLIMVMQVSAGKLINRFGETRLIPVGLLLSGAGFFLLQFADSWAFLLPPLAVFVAGNALVFPSVSSLITKRVVGKRGAVLGLDGSFKSAGQMVGPLLAGFLYGLNPVWAFFGLALCIAVYAAVFVAVSPKFSASA
ncbi:MAG: MFS transporter, partial [Candidatus Micrarchaeota archaeon]|nr:MFS transporter [Candidatus Micrarchaeota archaeon]